MFDLDDFDKEKIEQWFNLAMFNSSMLDEVIKALEKAMEFAPDQNIILQYLARCYKNKEDFPKAIGAYEKLIIANPNDDELWYTLSFVYEDLKKDLSAELARSIGYAMKNQEFRFLDGEEAKNNLERINGAEKTQESMVKDARWGLGMSRTYANKDGLKGLYYVGMAFKNYRDLSVEGKTPELSSLSSEITEVLDEVLKRSDIPEKIKEEINKARALLK